MYTRSAHHVPISNSFDSIVVSFLTTQAKVCPMVRLVLSFTSASQRTCIRSKRICEHTWNLPRTASSSFFIPSIFLGSRIYDRAFRADDRFARLVSSASTSSDIPFSSLNIECQHHSGEDWKRDMHLPSSSIFFFHGSNDSSEPEWFIASHRNAVSATISLT